MKIAIPTETADGETRVAAVPETVRRYLASGWEVVVQAGAGERAFCGDDEYEAVGARVVDGAKAALAGADVVLKLQPSEAEAGLLAAGSALVALFDPAPEARVTAALAEAGVTVFSLALLPRITRTQSMDALSSMATLDGYKAVLMAADRLTKMMPMMMTAAGTLQPARALIIGAGVAGLQATATARRLGAVVKAVDTRPVAREHVESLGARFVPLEVDHQAEGEGGYAADLGEEFYRGEQELLSPHVSEADIVVCSAQIPGRRAPVLITEAMVEAMGGGAVIVDLAVRTGGNCTLTRADECVEAHGVTVLGPTNLAGAMPGQASRMYSRNVAAFLGEIVSDGHIRSDADDEVVAATMVAHDGEVLSGRARAAPNPNGKESPS